MTEHPPYPGKDIEAFLSSAPSFSQKQALPLVGGFGDDDDPEEKIKSNTDPAEDPEDPQPSKGKEHPAPPTFNDGQQYVIMPGSLVVLDKLPAQIKKDVTNAQLFAQLIADKTYERSTDPLKWYEAYIEVLAKIGFTVTQTKSLTYEDVYSSTSIDESLIQLIMAMAGDEAEAGPLTQKAFSSLSKSAGSSKLDVFSHDTKSLQIRDVQVSYIAHNTAGQTVMAMGAFVYDQKQENLTVLFFFSGEKGHLNLSAKGSQLVLNESLYANHARDKIEDKLGTKIDDFIDGFNL